MAACSCCCCWCIPPLLLLRRLCLMRPLGAHGCRCECHHIRGLLNHLGGGLARPVPSLHLYSRQQRVALRRIRGACGAGKGGSTAGLSALITSAACGHDLQMSSCNAPNSKASKPPTPPTCQHVLQSSGQLVRVQRHHAVVVVCRGAASAREEQVSKQAGSSDSCSPAFPSSTPASTQDRYPLITPPQCTSRGDQKGGVLLAATQRGCHVVKG